MRLPSSASKAVQLQAPCPADSAGRRGRKRCTSVRLLVQRTSDVTVATDRGVPRSTARGWVGAAPTAVVGLDVADLTEPELRQQVLKLRRRVQKLRRCSGS